MEGVVDGDPLVLAEHLARLASGGEREVVWSLHKHGAQHERTQGFRTLVRLVQEELLKLELITQQDVDDQDPDKPAYKKYFMHGTSHHLGLDVHDVGDNSQPVKEGMVFTIEPGIYIREEGFGCRLENNYLVTADGTRDLMADIPVEADEIEELMNA